MLIYILLQIPIVLEYRYISYFVSCSLYQLWFDFYFNSMHLFITSLFNMIKNYFNRRHKKNKINKIFNRYNRLFLRIKREIIDRKRNISLTSLAGSSRGLSIYTVGSIGKRNCVFRFQRSPKKQLGWPKANSRTHTHTHIKCSCSCG